MWGHKGCSITHNGPTLLLPKVIYNEQALFQANLLCWYNSPHIIAHTHNYTYFHLNQNYPLNTMQTSTRFKIQSSRTHARAILGDSLSVSVCLYVCVHTLSREVCVIGELKLEPRVSIANNLPRPDGYQLNKDGDHSWTYLFQWQQRWELLHDNKDDE